MHYHKQLTIINWCAHLSCYDHFVRIHKLRLFIDLTDWIFPFKKKSMSWLLQTLVAGHIYCKRLTASFLKPHTFLQILALSTLETCLNLMQSTFAGLSRLRISRSEVLIHSIKLVLLPFSFQAFWLWRLPRSGVALPTALKLQGPWSMTRPLSPYTPSSLHLSFPFMTYRTVNYIFSKYGMNAATHYVQADQEPKLCTLHFDSCFKMLQFAIALVIAYSQHFRLSSLLALKSLMRMVFRSDLLS